MWGFFTGLYIHLFFTWEKLNNFTFFGFFSLSFLKFYIHLFFKWEKMNNFTFFIAIFIVIKGGKSSPFHILSPTRVTCKLITVKEENTAIKSNL